jgi:hypothetical protein
MQIRRKPAIKFVNHLNKFYDFRILLNPELSRNECSTGGPTAKTICPHAVDWNNRLRGIVPSVDGIDEGSGSEFRVRSLR